MKTCSKCGESKPVSDFPRASSTRDGLYAYCKICSSAKNSAWRAANRDKRKESQAAWAEANKDKLKEKWAEYRAENRDRLNAYNATWRAENPDKAKAATAAWAAANPELLRIYVQNRMARKREAGGKLTKGIADRLFKLQNGKCACCGLPLGDNYHLEHIMPIALGGSNTDDNIQLLRARCNIQKKDKHPIEFMQQRGFLL